MKRIAIIGSCNIGTTTFIREALTARAMERIELMKKEKEAYEEDFVLEPREFISDDSIKVFEQPKSKYHK